MYILIYIFILDFKQSLYDFKRFYRTITFFYHMYIILNNGP